MLFMQKLIGNNLIIFGDFLSGNIPKIILPISSGLIAVFVDINKRNLIVFSGAVDTILYVVRLAVIGIFSALFVFIIIKFFSSLFGNIGRYLVKLSKIARFSLKPVEDIEKDIKYDFFLNFKNEEWFASAKDVRCSITSGVVLDYYEKERKQEPTPITSNLKWIDNNERSVFIKNGKCKNLRFFQLDIPNADIVIPCTDIKNKNGEIRYHRGKYQFGISFTGKIKDGSFFARSDVVIDYRGRDEVYLEPIGKSRFKIEITEKVPNTQLSF